MKDVKQWHSELFKQEIERLCGGFLQLCLLWGLIYGGDDDNDNDDQAIERAIQFTRNEFPKRYPELGFKKVCSTLFSVATIYENGVLVVRPEINTIYSYFQGSKHDLITPIIMTLVEDCFLQAHILQTVSSN